MRMDEGPVGPLSRRPVPPLARHGAGRRSAFDLLLGGEAPRPADRAGGQEDGAAEAAAGRVGSTA